MVFSYSWHHASFRSQIHLDYLSKIPEPALPDRNKLNKDQHYVGYELEHDFTENLKLLQRARLAYSKIDYNSAYNGLAFAIASLPPAPGGPGVNDTNPDHAILVKHVVDEEAYQGTIDTALTYDAKFNAVESQLLLGFDYFRGSSKTDIVNGPGGVLNLYTGQFLDPNPFADPDISGYDKQDITQAGLYAVANSRIYENFRLDLSLRNDWLSVDRSSDSTATGLLSEDKGTESYLSGRVGLSYVSDFGLTPYASYSSSFEAPQSGATKAGVFFDPETSRQFEVGLKYAPESFNGFFSVAGFQIDKQNVVNIDPTDSRYRVQSGKVRVRGLEFEGALELYSGLSAIGSYSYLDIEILKDPNGLSGNALARAPEHSGSLWLKYEFQQDWLEGLSVGAGARYIGKRYADSGNAIDLDPVTLFDGAFAYEYNNIELSLSGRNLFDKSFISHCGSESLSGVLAGVVGEANLPNYDTYNCTYGKGRELRLQLSATF